MDKVFLKFITILNPVFKGMGVDTNQLYQILKTKLLIDSRRPKQIFAAGKGLNPSNQSQASWSATIFSIIMGILIGMVLFITKLPFVGQTLYFSIFMTLMSITLISDFTTVLIDTRDQFIIMPRPVNDRTIAISRVLHISIYVFRTALLQGLPGLIMIGFIDGILAVPLFFLQILLATLLSIFVVNITYLLVMKSVSPQKFKDIINYFQIAFSVLLFGTYYHLPKLINVSVLENISLLSHWWAYLVPPVWISALNELLIHHTEPQSIIAGLALTGLVAPIVGLWLVVKVLAPGFNKRLAIIATSDGNSNSTISYKEGKINFIDKLANLITPDPVENAGFKITWKLAARIREFKLKVYPAFAYVPVYFLFITLNGKGAPSERLALLEDSNKYVFLIYLCSFVLVSVLTNISMTSKYKSAWVYYVLPIEKPGKILSGMYKAILTIYFLPYCFIIDLVIVSIWGPHAINDIILGTVLSIIYGMVLALFMVKGLPFSKPVSTKQSSGKMISSFVILALIGVVGYAHYFLMKWEMLIWVLIIPFLILNWVMFRYYKKQTWENIELSGM